MKKRIDKQLVDLGLVRSRARAHELIKSGNVSSHGQVITKPSHEVDEIDLLVKDNENYVGRGAQKIASAGEAFNLKFEGKTIVDVGSSTGGFTDFALRNGAEKVYAIDVGVNQLDFSLRSDPRVVVMEETDIRAVDPMEQVDMAVIDVSFISLVYIWPAVLKWVKAEGEILSLVKPQFEVGPSAIGKGGIVKDLEQHHRILRQLQEYAETIGLKLTAAHPCGIKGKAGNQEYFFYFNQSASVSAIDLHSIVWQEKNL
jgi:23S rRNA (cytidine1920-2'-O)/16S rRNA (cytidine1409-2'-O)-methyltransferase